MPTGARVEVMKCSVRIIFLCLVVSCGQSPVKNQSTSPDYIRNTDYNLPRNRDTFPLRRYRSFWNPLGTLKWIYGIRSKYISLEKEYRKLPEGPQLNCVADQISRMRNLDFEGIL